jgi:hypothetical protein
MRCDDLRQHAPLVVRLSNEAHVPQPQVSKTAVDELGRCARGRASEVPCIHECDSKTDPGGVSSDSGTDDPSADDQQIEAALGESLDCAAPI